jgi:hypothetical protein
MERIASALTSDLDDLEHLGESLAQTLAPLLSSPRRSSFAGPFSVHVVDLRQVDDELLPGPMHAAAPSMLCVHDRLRPRLHAAVLLAGDGASRSLGLTPCLQHDAASAASFGVPIALPAVRSPHAHVAFASGFVAVSAEDSQRLWIVESAA